MMKRPTVSLSLWQQWPYTIRMEITGGKSKLSLYPNLISPAPSREFQVSRHYRCLLSEKKINSSGFIIDRLIKAYQWSYHLGFFGWRISTMHHILSHLLDAGRGSKSWFIFLLLFPTACWKTLKNMTTMVCWISSNDLQHFNTLLLIARYIFFYWPSMMKWLRCFFGWQIMVFTLNPTHKCGLQDHTLTNYPPQDRALQDLVSVRDGHGVPMASDNGSCRIVRVLRWMPEPQVALQEPQSDQLSTIQSE